jgi:hypothetical protein
MVGGPPAWLGQDGVGTQAQGGRTVLGVHVGAGATTRAESQLDAGLRATGTAVPGRRGSKAGHAGPFVRRAHSMTVPPARSRSGAIGPATSEALSTPFAHSGGSTVSNRRVDTRGTQRGATPLARCDRPLPGGAPP